MESNAILIGWPSESVRELYSTDASVYFLDNHGWWAYDEIIGERINKYLGYDNFDDVLGVSISSIWNAVNWWSILWTRHFGSATEYEHIRGDAYSNVCKLIVGLRQLKVGVLLSHTGVPHHYEDSLLSIACEVCEIPQVYLYSTVFDSELLPVIQGGNISTRTVLPCNIRQFDYGPILDEFVSRKRNNLSPATSPELRHSKLSWWKESYLVSFGVNLQRSLVIRLSRILRFMRSKRSYLDIDWVKSGDYKLLDAIRISFCQHSYLNLYEKSQLWSDGLEDKKRSDEPLLLIAAHFQPEATSFPEGASYGNHIAIALKIRALGHKREILYKEHPATWGYSAGSLSPTRVGLCRSNQYLNTLSELGCTFLPRNTQLSINQTDCGWYVPVTIGGSLALERSLAGLVTIVAGEVWYKGLPGVVALADIEDLQLVPKHWAVPNTTVALAAREFLKIKLSNNTIPNSIGIGSGVKQIGRSVDFLQAYNNLIAYLKCVDKNSLQISVLGDTK